MRRWNKPDYVFGLKISRYFAGIPCNLFKWN